MTNAANEIKQIKKKYKALQEHFGDSLVNFEHYPGMFTYQVQLYNYVKAQEEAAKNVQVTPQVYDYT